MCNVERTTMWALRLFILSESFDVEALRNRVAEQHYRLLNIIPVHSKPDAAEQVRNEPIHANHVFIEKKALNACRIKHAFCKQCFRQVTELQHGYHVSRLEPSDSPGFGQRSVQSSLFDFLEQHLARNIG